MHQLVPVRVLIDNHNRLDEVARLVAHAEQRLLKVFPAVIEMCDLGMEVKTAGGNEAGELLHAQTSARHQTAANVLVAHANAPFDTRNVDVVTGTQVVDVADLAAGLQALDGGLSFITCSSMGPSL